MNKDALPRVVLIMARWLARKAVRAEWKAMGRQLQYADASELAAASNVYFIEHREELLKEAWEHPVAQHYRHQERMKFARKAVIAEIREKGRRVNSIAPEELNKLIKAYLEEHRWECALDEKICF
jgi:hypothetical protein